ncbi:putative zinc finger C2HC domain-containing protein 1A [Apostichopus japonicus]|uniref:Putative zinc finger C2HC domain-containing protein 1A n=1 Tax=Stichopus japonicus TaxID=307972 RepID=A0A2G8JC75_STIJA|nr:putative zinc finger C2HC domain-containing protein 1A [Apostichopus japonicus]
MDSNEIPERVASPPDLEPCPCCGRTFVLETLKKKNNWRQKHEDFIEAMRSAREVTHAMKTGAPLPTPVSQKPRVNPDYVQCPSCSRHFNESAAERHIPWCKEKSKRIGAPEKKKEQLNTRTKYKPPLPGAKKLKSPIPRSNLSRTVGKSNKDSLSRETLEDKFDESMTIGRRRSGPPPRQERPSSLSGPKARSSSLERPIVRKQGRNNSGDSLRRRNYSEDEYDDSTGDENISEPSPLTNGYHSRSSRIFPHHKVKSANSDRSSPLTGRTPTPPLSRKSSLESIGRRPSKFCYECGTKYPVPHAKFLLRMRYQTALPRMRGQRSDKTLQTCSDCRRMCSPVPAASQDQESLTLLNDVN